MHGANVGTAAQRVREQRQAAPSHRRFDFFIKHLNEQTRGMGTGFVHIDMRIGFEAHHDIAVRHRFFSDLAVQIKRRGNGGFRQYCPQTLE